MFIEFFMSRIPNQDSRGTCRWIYRMGCGNSAVIFLDSIATKVVGKDPVQVPAGTSGASRSGFYGECQFAFRQYALHKQL